MALVIGGMFGYDSITVSYAWEFISVSMCYSQGDGFNTFLSRFVLYPRVTVLLALRVYGVSWSVYCVGCSCRWHGHVLPGTTLIKIMCVHQLYQQG